jgi:hypothetical protein
MFLFSGGREHGEGAPSQPGGSAPLPLVDIQKLDSSKSGIGMPKLLFHSHFFLLLHLSPWEDSSVTVSVCFLVTAGKLYIFFLQSDTFLYVRDISTNGDANPERTFKFLLFFICKKYYNVGIVVLYHVTTYMWFDLVTYFFHKEIFFLNFPLKIFFRDIIAERIMYFNYCCYPSSSSFSSRANKRIMAQETLCLLH